MTKTIVDSGPRTVSTPGMASVVFLFGNGLSIGVSPAFAVEALTARLNESLDAHTRRALVEVANLGRPDRPEPDVRSRELGFEEYAGPIDRVASAVRILAPLAAGSVREVALWEAYDFLRERYVQLVGLVMNEIRAAARIGETARWEELNAFAVALRGLHEKHRGAVMTLSYDTLLESAMIESHKGWFYDGFAGMTLNHPLNCFPGTLPVYHLHGSVLWYETADGEVRKTRSDGDLHSQLMEEWSRGEGDYGLPVVMLTDLKTRAAAQYPFDLFYNEFWNELTGARRLIVGGYGWGDVPVNAVVRAWLVDRAIEPTRTLEVWGPPELRARAVAVLSLDDELVGRVEHYDVRLPDVAALEALETRLASSPPT